LPEAPSPRDQDVTLRGEPCRSRPEFIAGLAGFYGIGRLLAGRVKEARVFLIISLALIIPLGLAPQILLGDQYADWITWLIKAGLATLSALHLNLMLDRAQRTRVRSR